MKKQITCIVCPRGCIMTAEGSGDQWVVAGNACKRGEKHAIGECTNPVRSLTSIVRVSNREDTMVSVKSAAPVPKDKMFEIMDRIHATSVEAPVAIGDVILSDVILSDVYGTVIVATKEIL